MVKLSEVKINKKRPAPRAPKPIQRPVVISGSRSFSPGGPKKPQKQQQHEQSITPTNTLKTHGANPVLSKGHTTTPPKRPTQKSTGGGRRRPKFHGDPKFIGYLTGQLGGPIDTDRMPMHEHSLLAYGRASLETETLNIIRRLRPHGKIMDVGASFRAATHPGYRGRIHGCENGRDAYNTVKMRDFQDSPIIRYFDEQSDCTFELEERQQVNTVCPHDMELCPCLPATDVLLMTHSLYYITPAKLARCLASEYTGDKSARIAFAIVHRFPRKEGHFFEEAHYAKTQCAIPLEVKADYEEFPGFISKPEVKMCGYVFAPPINLLDMVRMEVAGNSEPYVHPDVEWLFESTRRIVGDGTLQWKIERRAVEMYIIRFDFIPRKIPPPLAPRPRTRLVNQSVGTAQAKDIKEADLISKALGDPLVKVIIEQSHYLFFTTSKSLRLPRSVMFSALMANTGKETHDSLRNASSRATASMKHYTKANPTILSFDEMVAGPMVAASVASMRRVEIGNTVLKERLSHEAVLGRHMFNKNFEADVLSPRRVNWRMILGTVFVAVFILLIFATLGGALPMVEARASALAPKGDAPPEPPQVRFSEGLSILYKLGKGLGEWTRILWSAAFKRCKTLFVVVVEGTVQFGVLTFTIVREIFSQAHSWMWERWHSLQRPFFHYSVTPSSFWRDFPIFALIALLISYLMLPTLLRILVWVTKKIYILTRVTSWFFLAFLIVYLGLSRAQAEPLQVYPNLTKDDGVPAHSFRFRSSTGGTIEYESDYPSDCELAPTAKYREGRGPLSRPLVVGSVLAGLGFSAAMPLVQAKSNNNLIISIRTRVLVRAPNEPDVAYFKEALARVDNSPVYKKFLYADGAFWPTDPEPLFDAFTDNDLAHHEIAEVDFEQYLETRPRDKRRALRNAHDNLLDSGVKLKTLMYESFMKRENILALCVDYPFEEFRPRNIQAIPMPLKVILGPWFWAYSNALKDVLNISSSIWYCSGAKLSDLSAWATHHVARLEVYGLILYLSTDFSKYDVTQHVHWVQREHKHYRALGFAQACHPYLDTAAVLAFMRRAPVVSQGHFWSVDGTRKSGDLNTSSGNSKNTADVILSFFLRHMTYEQFVTWFAIAVLGDDVFIIASQLGVLKIPGDICALLVTHAALLGLSLKVRIDKDILSGEFCSGKFYPVKGGYAYGKKPGRTMCKLGWFVSKKGRKPRLYRRLFLGSMRSQLAASSHVPFLRKYLRVCMNHLKPEGLVPMYETPFHESREILEKVRGPSACDSTTWEAFTRLYGLGPGDESRFEQDLIEHVKVHGVRTVFHHPMVSRIYGIERSMEL